MKLHSGMGMNNVREVVTVRAIHVPELVGFVAVAVLLLGVCVPTFLPDSLLKTAGKEPSRIQCLTGDRQIPVHGCQRYGLPGE